VGSALHTPTSLAAVWKRKSAGPRPGPVGWWQPEQLAWRYDRALASALGPAYSGSTIVGSAFGSPMGLSKNPM
jgi:hypothetical protein